MSIGLSTLPQIQTGRLRRTCSSSRICSRRACCSPPHTISLWARRTAYGKHVCPRVPKESKPPRSARAAQCPPLRISVHKKSQLGPRILRWNPWEAHPQTPALCLSNLCRRGRAASVAFCISAPQDGGQTKEMQESKADAKGHPEEASCLRSKPPCEPLISQEGKQQQYGHLQGEPQHPETDAFQHYDSSPRPSNARISSKSSLLRGWDCTSAAIRDFGEFRYSFSTKVSVSAAR